MNDLQGFIEAMYVELQCTCSSIIQSMKRGGSAMRSEFTRAVSDSTVTVGMQLCSSFLTLVANKQLGFSARLTHKFNRKFVRTDVAMNDSEETATAFTVSQTSHNSSNAPPV